MGPEDSVRLDSHILRHYFSPLKGDVCLYTIKARPVQVSLHKLFYHRNLAEGSKYQDITYRIHRTIAEKCSI